jgi:hypothetical protein
MSGLDVVNDQELFDIPCPSCFEFQTCIKKLMVLQLQSPKFFWNIKRHVWGHKLLNARLENNYEDGSKMNKK